MVVALVPVVVGLLCGLPSQALQFQTTGTQAGTLQEETFGSFDFFAGINASSEVGDEAVDYHDLSLKHAFTAKDSTEWKGPLFDAFRKDLHNMGGQLGIVATQSAEVGQLELRGPKDAVSKAKKEFQSMLDVYRPSSHQVDHLGAKIQKRLQDNNNDVLESVAPSAKENSEVAAEEATIINQYNLEKEAANNKVEITGNLVEMKAEATSYWDTISTPDTNEAKMRHENGARVRGEDSKSKIEERRVKAESAKATAIPDAYENKDVSILAVDHGHVQEPMSEVDEESLPKVLVAIHSTRTHVPRRAHMRGAWKRAGLGDRFIMKFAICNSVDQENRPFQEEDAGSDDILLLDCDEGFNQGAMTRKQLELMKTYQESYGKRHLLLQIEDDTFVAWHKFRNYIENEAALDLENAYMGVPIEEGRPVNRDSSSLWYQSSDTYADETYPLYMERIGYALGHNLVMRILDEGVGPGFFLANHEQAAGVWVKMLQNAGALVQYVRIPAPSKDDSNFDACGGKPWRDYPFMMHHGIVDSDLACLSSIDASDNEDTAMESCLADCHLTR